jgi:very-short-patch-repair endonuclease
MRFNLTPSEAALWRHLSGRRLGGIAFKRQVPVGPFVVDFLAPRERVVVEVDGGYHARRAGADARRDAKLRRWGYRVVRLEAQVVLADMPQALRVIRLALGQP